MTTDPRSPCLIGVAHRTWHPSEVGDEGAPEPLAMWEEVARAAASDAGNPAALSQLDQVNVVYCQAWQYDDPPGRLSERLGASPRHARYSGIGGSVPQVLAAETAQAIQSGELELSLLVGAEALATTRKMSKEGAKPNWSFPPAEKRRFPFDIPFHPAEVAHSIFEAYLTFALFDNARRHHLGLGLEEYRRHLGAALETMTEVAAANPDAWFPIRRSSAEIVTPTPENRLVAYPYTKLMTAIMDIDMAAAVVMASHEKADALGIHPDHRVYLRGWGYAEDPPYVAQRRQLWRSPAMSAASDAALGAAEIGIDAVAHLDLYSCFGSSIGFACDALGISGPEGQLDARPVTVTGGLPYHGGPGSNYVTHSIATMAQRLRADPGSYGLVSGVGMHMTKHVYGLWSTSPGPFVAPDRSALQHKVDQELSVVDIAERASGAAQVATYSVVHGRGGEAQWAALVCDLPDGSRCYARSEDAALLDSAEERELIGTTVHLDSDGKVNIARAP